MCSVVIGFLLADERRERGTSVDETLMSSVPSLSLCCTRCYGNNNNYKSDIVVTCCKIIVG
jgi:hypothetical protein